MQAEVGIVIPVYNNQLALNELDARINECMEQYEYRIIYVNDCSTDQSLNVLNSITQRNTNASILDLKENIGQQRATLEGIMQMNTRKIVVLDADLQDKPELIPQLYAQCRNNRSTGFIKRKGMYQTRARMLTSTIVKLTIQLLAGLDRKAGSFYMFDHTLKDKVVDLANRCPAVYLSIIVSRLSPEKFYIASERKIGAFGSNYSMRMRLLSARAAIRCALYCRFKS